MTSILPSSGKTDISDKSVADSELAFDVSQQEDYEDPRPIKAQLIGDAILIIVMMVGWFELAANEYIDFGQTEDDPGPGFIPRVALLMLGGGAALHALTLFVKARRFGGFRSDGEFAPDRIVVPFLLVLSLLLYYFAFPVFGYVISGIVLGAIWVPIFHWRSGATFQRRHIAFFTIEILLIPSAIFALFRYLIQVPLP